MLPDFSPVERGEVRFSDLAQQYRVADLQAATNASIDAMVALLDGLSDQQITFIPDDPLANDEYAPEGERYQGWSLAHLVVHVTASSEEHAAFSSLLARGIAYPREPRLRYETHWQSVTTRAQVVARLEESRRMRLAYLQTWPDQPSLTTLRDLSENFINKYGPQNAPAAFLFGLRHEVNHLPQMREAARQARERG